jgi:hypothetical protein
MLNSDYDNLIILDRNDRVFSAIATAECRDVQGETVPIANFKKAFFKAKKRYGGYIPLAINHRDWIAGQIFDGEDIEINGIPAFKVYGRVFASDDENPLFDETWNSLKNGDVRGLSIGGYKPLISSDGVLQTVPLTEISLITGFKDNGQPRNPANPLASILYHSMAKGDELAKPGEVDEAKWAEAKKVVRSEYPDVSENDDRFYKLTNSIYQNMLKSEYEFKENEVETMVDETQTPSQEIDLSKAMMKMAESMNAQTEMLNKIYKAVYKEEQPVVAEDKEVVEEQAPVEKTAELTDEGSGVEPAPEVVVEQTEVEKQEEPEKVEPESEEDLEKEDIEDDKEKIEEEDDSMEKSDDKMSKELLALRAEVESLKKGKVIASTPAPMMKADEGKTYQSVFEAEMSLKKQKLGL